jgi:hypothetical protein
MSGDWLVLVTTLPTGHAAMRMRVWREIRVLGAAILRDGVYLLPNRDELAAGLARLAQSVQEAEGAAHVMTVAAQGDQQQAWRELFDRSDEYGELLKRVTGLRRQLGAARADLAALRAEARDIQMRMAGVRATDYFPGAAGEQAGAAIGDLQAAIERKATPGEPAQQAGRIARLSRDDYQGRVWATRRGLWVDRIACAWLIRRFIDTKARFVWLADIKAAPKRALGFDYDGATFTHRDGKVSFEVLLASFSIDSDAALLQVGQLVHVLDAGGAPRPEAAGLEVVLRGMQRIAADDDALLAASVPVFDALHAAFTPEQT